MVPKAARSQSPPLADPQTPDGRWPHNKVQDLANPEEVTAFTQWRMSIYMDRKWTESDLSEYYGADFIDFTPDTFRIVSPDTLRDLRNQLRAAGVYVAPGRHLDIVEQLARVVQDELPWPPPEPPLTPECPAYT